MFVSGLNLEVFNEITSACKRVCNIKSISFYYTGSESCVFGVSKLFIAYYNKI